MYFINDKTDDAQRFPLDKLLRLIRSGAEVEWIVSRASGYGADICEIEDEVERNGEVIMRPAALIQISDDPEQWFYDLACRSVDEDISFGLIDSGRLFVEGSSPRLKEIIRAFENVERRAVS